MVRRSNPGWGGAKFSAPVQTGPGTHPSSCTGSPSPGLNGRDVTLTTHPYLPAEVKERVQLYLYSPSGPSWPVLEWTLPLPYLYNPHIIYSTKDVFPGGKGCRCLRLTTLPPSSAVVMKSGNFNFLEPSGPLQACNGTAFPLPYSTG
jgi:hypothetical protein